MTEEAIMSFEKILRLLRSMLRITGDANAARKGKLDKRLARRAARRQAREALRRGPR